MVLIVMGGGETRLMAGGDEALRVAERPWEWRRPISYGNENAALLQQGFE